MIKKRVRKQKNIRKKNFSEEKFDENTDTIQKISSKKEEDIDLHETWSKRDVKSNHKRSRMQHTTRRPSRPKIDIHEIKDIDMEEDIKTTIENDMKSESDIKSEQKEFEIPDAMVIEEAKRRRKQAREASTNNMKSEPEFIPLSEEDLPRRRFVKKKNDDDSEEEEEEEIEIEEIPRMKFGEIQDDTMKEMKEAIEMIQEEEQDEEWEEEQMRKAGIKKPKKKKEKPKKLISKIEYKYTKKEGENVIASIDEVEKQLQESLNQLNMNYNQHCQLLNRLIQEEEESNQSILKLSEELSIENDKYKFFQEMRSYIEDLVDCLDNKVPLIEENEDRLLRLREDTAHERYKSFLQSLKLKIYEEMEEEEENIGDSIIEESKNIFKDTRDEFSKLSKIKEKFIEWKMKYPKSYVDTYCELSVEKVFAPFIRLELLEWNPLSNVPFEDLNWYKELLDYFNRTKDEHLIPDLVKQIVLPIARHSLGNVYNVYSTNQTRNAQSLISDLLVYMNNQSLKDLYLDLLDRMNMFANDIQLPNEENEYSIKLFHYCVKLFRNIASWRTKLNVLKPILDILIDKLINFIKITKNKNEYLKQVCMYLPNEMQEEIKNKFYR